MSSELGHDAWFEATTLGFLWRQFTKPKLLPPGIQLTDQVAIVTGSNVGLGLSASRQLLRLGLSRLIMGVRSQDKGEYAAQQLRDEFPDATVSVWVVDMESYDSVCAFADRCKVLERIDIVILNAGLIKPVHTTAPATRHEVTLQVNYLSTVLLAILLVSIQRSKRVLGAPRPPVLSIVGSDLAYEAVMDLKSPVVEQFDGPRQRYDPFTWYKRSKLLQIAFFSKLSEFISADDVLINISNPGMTRDTAFFRESSTIYLKLMAIAQAMLARTVDVAASTYLDAILVKDQKSHGSFVSDWAIKPYPPVLYTTEGQEFIEKLWAETMEELKFADVNRLIEGLQSEQ